MNIIYLRRQTCRQTYQVTKKLRLKKILKVRKTRKGLKLGLWINIQQTPS